MEILNTLTQDLLKLQVITSEEAIGKHTRILKSNQNDANIYTELWSTISNGKEWQGELLNKKKNGELFWELVSISPVKNSEWRNNKLCCY